MFKVPAFLQKKKEGPNKAKWLKSKEPIFDRLGRAIHRIIRVPSSSYTPGGAHPNVRGTYVRNPKIAAQINAMHDKWVLTKVFQ